MSNRMGKPSQDRDQAQGGARGNDLDARWQKVRQILRARLGEDVYSSWFNSMEFESFEDGVLRASVPVKFLRSWIQSHYIEELRSCAAGEFKDLAKVDVVLRQPNGVQPRQASTVNAPAPGDAARVAPRPTSFEPGSGEGEAAGAVATGRLFGASTDGSPLDPRYTFESYIVGAANRMAHAGAIQAAETVFGQRRAFNPLFIHSAVGLGKTHLLQAIAWEVKNRAPQASVMYLTAERFRYQFVDALRGPDPMGFKDRFRNADILLVDDLEFLSGPQTEQEFDHLINWLLDSGRQVVVASARAPGQIDKLNDRMRSRMQRGLVTEIAAPDYELRLAILEKRLAEKQQQDPTFDVPVAVLQLFAEKLTESGRELEGAIARLHAAWAYMKTAITLASGESLIRDLLSGNDQRRLKIEDILKVISRHYGVSKGDILSPRRDRSVVLPRQIGMYLAKQLTARSLPEIGRRFGNRDHTTVLHAIRKIEGQLTENPRLREEIEELKKILNA